MKKVTIYLAGKMAGLDYNNMNDWRTYAAERLRAAGFAIMNPVDTMGVSELKLIAVGDSPHPASEIVGSNLFQIGQSDIVLAEMEHVGISIGTIGEIIVASRELKKPVILWGENKTIFHPWVMAHVTAHRNSLAEAVRLLIETYGGPK